MLNRNYDDLFKIDLDTKVLEERKDGDIYYYSFEDTIFFVESGGMESDIGTINDLEVVDLYKYKGVVYHGLKEQLTDKNVHLHVDFSQRMRKVQIHSASHLMCGIINKEYNAPTIAFKAGEEYSEIEMGFHELNQAILDELEVKYNDFIRQDLPIYIKYPTLEEALKYVAVEKADHDDELRAVVIGDIDYNMCACIHVPSLKHLQAIKLLGFEKTTRGYKISFVVGMQLLEYMHAHYKVDNKASITLGVPQLEIDAGIQKVMDEKKALNNEVNELKQKLIVLNASSLASQHNETYFVHEFDDMDIKTFQAFTTYFVNNYNKGIIFILKLQDNCHVMVAHNKELTNMKSNELFKELSTKYGLRGGGNPYISQGGGIYSQALVESAKALVNSL